MGKMKIYALCLLADALQWAIDRLDSCINRLVARR